MKTRMLDKIPGILDGLEKLTTMARQLDDDDFVHFVLRVRADIQTLIDDLLREEAIDNET